MDLTVIDESGDVQLEDERDTRDTSARGQRSSRDTSSVTDRCYVFTLFYIIIGDALVRARALSYTVHSPHTHRA